MEKSLRTQLTEQVFLSSQRAIYNQYNQQVTFDGNPIVKGSNNIVFKANSINYDINSKELKFHKVHASFRQ